jgi:hypothetical protein
MRKPKAEPTPEPHDALVRWTFSQRWHAVGLLRVALPSALTRAVDWRTLRLRKETSVSGKLRKRHSDLVFSALAEGRALLLYVVLEHQSTVVRLMPFRMLLYGTRLWEQFVRDHPRARKLPVVLPVLLHHSRTGWTAATAFEDLIEAEGAVRKAVERYLPRFEMRVLDVSGGPPAAGALTALGRVVLWALSVAGDDERLEREFGKMREPLGAVLAAPDGEAALDVLMRYLAATHRKMSREKVGELLEAALGPKGPKMTMTWIDELEEKNRREGKLEGARGMLLQQIAARFGAVPTRVEARIRRADEAALRRWSIRVLTATTAAEVVGDTGGERARRGSSKRTAAAAGRAGATSRRA